MSIVHNPHNLPPHQHPHAAPNAQSQLHHLGSHPHPHPHPHPTSQSSQQYIPQAHISPSSFPRGTVDRQSSDTHYASHYASSSSLDTYSEASTSQSSYFRYPDGSVDQDQVSYQAPVLVHSRSDPLTFLADPAANPLEAVPALPVNGLAPVRPTLATSYSAPDPSMIPQISQLSSAPDPASQQPYPGMPQYAYPSQQPMHYHAHQPYPGYQHYPGQMHQHGAGLQYTHRGGPSMGAGMAMNVGMGMGGMVVAGNPDEWAAEWDEEEQGGVEWYHANMEVSDKIPLDPSLQVKPLRLPVQVRATSSRRGSEQEEQSPRDEKAAKTMDGKESLPPPPSRQSPPEWVDLGDRRASLAHSPPLRPPPAPRRASLAHLPTLPSVFVGPLPPLIEDSHISHLPPMGYTDQALNVTLPPFPYQDLEDPLAFPVGDGVSISLSAEVGFDLASMPPGTISDPSGQPLYTIRPDGKKVKHRRRTTPEQLKVLEHWFSINPKPDNALREWLAAELGMTKRNVQVWFQNRRAKIKGIQLKEKAAQEKAAQDIDEQRTPERQIIGSRPTTAQGIVADVSSSSSAAVAGSSSFPAVQASREMSIGLGSGLSGGRRVSLASGEAEKIQVWAAKRAGSTGLGSLGSPRTPALGLGQAAAARRGSIPYPTPLSASFDPTATGPPVSGSGGSGAASPKFSPSASLRPTPSTLHLTAIRNNTRRASMPNAPQLISSGPFTPPRLVSGSYPVPPARLNRELSPIKDADSEVPPSTQAQPGSGNGEYSFPETDFSTTYLTPPSSTYHPTQPYPPTTLDPAHLHRNGSVPSIPGLDSAPSSGSSYTYLPPSSEPYTPQGPLPNPGFSFGNNPIFSLGAAGSAPGAPAAGAAGAVQGGSAHLPGVATTSDEDAKRVQAIFDAMQQRGRLGSLASVGTWTTDETAGGYSGEDSEGEAVARLGLEAWDNGRRASAPAELLHNLGLLGINSLSLPGGSGPAGGMPLRPSPLGPGNGFTAINTQVTSLSPASAGADPSGAPYPFNTLTQARYMQESPVEMSAPHSGISPSGSASDLIPPAPGQGQSGQSASHSQGLSIVTNDTALSGPAGTVSAPASAFPFPAGQQDQAQLFVPQTNMPTSTRSSPGSGMMSNTDTTGLDGKKHRSLSPFSGAAGHAQSVMVVLEEAE